jgi:hypothetical protein
LAGTAPSVTVQDEDDLAETNLYVWIDNLTTITGSSLYFDVYSVFPTDLVMWTASTKGSRLHRGVEDNSNNNRITAQTRLATLSNESGQNKFTRTVYMEANAAVTGTVTLQAKPVSNPNAPAGSDSVKVSGINFGLQPYTPQTEPFQPWAIEERNWKTNGVGIRRNTDFDNGSTTADSAMSGTITNENDLIQTYVSMTATTGIKYVLRKNDTELKLWQSSTKGTEYVFTNNEYVFQNNTSGNIWVEYASAGNSNLSFTLVAIDITSNNELFTEEIIFKPFNSVVVVLGGESQVPNDPVNITGNHGLFDWAIARYREGYNVYMYDEDNCNPWGQGQTYIDIVNSINNHYVQSVAIVGYSHGGGSAYGLSWRLNENVAGRITDITRDFDIVLTGYIDAVQDSTASPETRRPLLSQYHVNFYQRNDYLLYGSATVVAPTVGPTENYQIDSGGNSVGHGNIDDEPFVIQTLEYRLKLRIPFSSR